MVEDETMSVIKQNARLNVFITGSRPQASMKPTVTGRIGHIYHITKHRGIIGLGRNEHVFYRHHYLNRLFHVENDLFCGNSILLHKEVEQDGEQRKYGMSD